MNLDPHWLKERFKRYDNEDLEVILFDLENFGGTDVEKKEMRAEIERRERETHENSPA